MRQGLTAAAVLLLAPAGAAAAPAYTAKPAPFSAQPQFDVAYDGSGTWRTRFHARPTNPGGKADTNDARDSSTQSWRLRFRRRLTVPACGAPPDGTADPCSAVSGVSGARGVSRATGRIDHTHDDGLYRQLDRTVRCRVRASTKARTRVQASIGVTYVPEAQAFDVTAYHPVTTVLLRMRTSCPKQGDSIDRIADNYFTPGFSFDSDYTPERWFTSRTVRIPAEVFHGSATITVPVADTRAGTPPRRCAVPDPKRERCTTGGSWSGSLVFTRRGS